MDDVALAEFQAVLLHVHYPSTKADLVQEARDRGATDDLVGSLSDLPDREYASPWDLRRELGFDHHVPWPDVDEHADPGEGASTPWPE
ncbi:MAG TPA: DUF2795 domain-containing protein [Acidimicrobiia bacterium]|nr:DUF2795 domain-containing protein [Acidimicrobiia bacterium]